MARNLQYLTKHHTGAWQYQRHVPKWAILLWGKRIKEYIGDVGQKEAERERNKFAARDDLRFDNARALSPDRAAQLVKDGGLRYEKILARLLVALPTYKPPTPAELAELSEGELTDKDAAAFLYHLDKTIKDQTLLMQAQHERIAAVAAEVEPPETFEPSEFDFDGLFKLWRDVKKTKRPRETVRTLKLLKAFFPNMRDYRRDIASADVRLFRDHMLTELGLPYSSRVGHMNNWKGLYSAAVMEGILKEDDVPTNGIVVHGGADRKPRLAFTPAQGNLILEAAKAPSFAGYRHEASLWVVKLLAHTGCRLGEITQLQRGDVCEEDNVPYLYIRQACVMTGKRHPQKSVKNGEERVVPLVPELAGFLDYAKGPAGEFVFDCFKFNSNKRNGYVSGILGKLIKRLAIVAPAGKIIDGYSFRARFARAGRDRELDDKHMNYVMGHAASLHDKYAHGVGLTYLAATVAKVRPLDD